jgi:hypothetical protein
MLRSIQRLRASLLAPTPYKSAARRYLSITPNKASITPLFRRDLYKSLGACQKFHTITPLYKEQDPQEEPEKPHTHQMLIGFTCKVCQERSHHTMSKHSYTKGVVLIQCPGCKNRHLIADNLGWFRDNKTTVEDLVKEKGEAIRKIIVDEQGVERLGDLMEWLPEITEEEKVKKEQAKLKAEEVRQTQE